MEIFAPEQVDQVLSNILKELDLNFKLEMSKSGAYRVILCKNKNLEQYIVKIRQYNNVLAKQAFFKESIILKSLSESQAPFTTAQDVFFKSESEPEVLIYKLVKGEALGWYYFYTSVNQLKILTTQPITKALQFIQALSLESLSEYLNTVTKEQLLDCIKFYKSDAINMGLDEKLFKACYDIVEKNSERWLKDLVLCHGDFNPKNIILTSKNLALIDWSDACLANKYFDIAFLYLCLWRTPDMQDKLVEQLEASAEFWQTVCFWIPKYYTILKNVSDSLKQEFEAGDIPMEAKEDNLKYIEQALNFYKTTLPEIIKKATQ